MAETITSSAQIDLQVRDLGRVDYASAYELQKQLQAEVIACREHRDISSRMHLLLLEHHPPVITISRRRGAASHLIATPAQLTAAGVEVAETDRGGDITYHGPGQLVVYAILDLNVLNLRLHGYLRLLEQMVIEVLAEFGIRATRDASATGVWVEDQGNLPGSDRAQGPGRSDDGHDLPGRSAAKICALGVRITRWVSMHGLALNVTTNLDHFNLIVPCGLAGRSVTNMRRELGSGCPSMEEVKRAIAETFGRTLPATCGRGRS